mmetsp:Transcript_20646/g.46571  ORF Transcript_20646/g.46571 Transcript_20646/m.46571 type:complete len:242 (+) Transcript_20646:206-931(+)
MYSGPCAPTASPTPSSPSSDSKPSSDMTSSPPPSSLPAPSHRSHRLAPPPASRAPLPTSKGPKSMRTATTPQFSSLRSRNSFTAKGQAPRSSRGPNIRNTSRTRCEWQTRIRSGSGRSLRCSTSPLIRRAASRFDSLVAVHHLTPLFPASPGRTSHASSATFSALGVWPPGTGGWFRVWSTARRFTSGPVTLATESTEPRFAFTSRASASRAIPPRAQQPGWPAGARARRAVCRARARGEE